MPKTILITGSTDGIGFEAARMLVAAGHSVLLHGRNPDKLARVESVLAGLSGGGGVEVFLADLSDLKAVGELALAVRERHRVLDVLINNAGVYHVPSRADAAFDVRFMVNTIAPYALTQQLLPLLPADGRVINLSSAAQAPVMIDALRGQRSLSSHEAYAQSKLAITMWSRAMARSLGEHGPVVIPVNPGSMLGTKMVQEAFGVVGGDVSIGADILCRLALDEAFASSSGQYFDNDIRSFGPPHPDALNAAKCDEIVATLDAILSSSASS